MNREKISNFVLTIMLNYERFYTKDIMKLIAQTREYKWSIADIVCNAIYNIKGEIVNPHEYDDIIDEWITRRYYNTSC